MTKADACLLLRDTQEKLKKDPARVHVLLNEALTDALISTEAPTSEVLTVIWSAGYTRGLLAAMHANMIPPIDTDEAYEAFIEAMQILLTDYLTRFRKEMEGKGKMEDDVVEVVRCKDCEHFVRSDGVCKVLSNNYEPLVCVEDDDYCSMGEKRGEDGTH